MYDLNLKINEVVTSSRLANLFEVKTLKASRFIKEKNALVIITDYTKSHCPDKWIGEVLHYTGGQKIAGSTNSKLADSRTNGVSVHLFQVMKPGEYTYGGLVKLDGDPYTETQPDKNGAHRRVWRFPLRPESDRVAKPNGLVFADMEDYKNRGKQAYLDFFRRRANYVGYRVRHIEHGLGTVDAFDGTVITVTFDNRQTKTYNFDRSIKGGYLQFAA